MISNLGLLVFFKYFNFFSANLNKIFSALTLPISSPILDILLPVGISFYTFQTLSYTIDVYNKKIQPEKHFGYFALYVSFFPQLVAGPIERPQNLLPQLRSGHDFDYNQVTYGLKLVAWGLFKKIVIADTLAMYVNKVYNNLPDYQGFSLVLATLFFSLQIYCDFSGYSDIAIGAARIIGIDLMKNFNAPYLATSIKDFWARWHISLSTWFRDYVYIPLGGSRGNFVEHTFNLLITFLLSGLWHGANWTFVIWGVIHGLLLVGETIYDKVLPSVTSGKSPYLRPIKTVITFTVVSIAWIFFRANNIYDAFYVLENMLNGASNVNEYFNKGIILLGIGQIVLGQPLLQQLLCGVFILMAFDIASLRTDVIKKVSELPVAGRWLLYVLLVLIIIMHVPTSSAKHEFIYFQF